MNVIRIPTKFSKSIKRLSDKERLQVFDFLLKIGDDEIINTPDSGVGDIVTLIYGEWMNMESRNGTKPTFSHISEGVGTVYPSESEHRVEESIVEYNKIEDNKIEISTIVDTTKALIVSENKSKPEINTLIESIKQTLEPIGLIYKAGKQERQRAQNILTAKEFGETCEKAGMSREKFVIEIIKLSAKLDFWNGKIYNCETFYEHYPKVYNEARRMKKEKEAKKIHSY